MTTERPTVFAVDEYEAQQFDGVLIQDDAVVCLDAGERARVIPMDKVNHIDADPDLLLTGAEVPDSFFGGAEYAFVDPSKFDRLQEHLDAIERENY
ncbi:hypothetical protein [Halomicrococcus sp. NG-SE-24]|uniref:hypothetical protein n=1 Tax=Halomicrococcus sp. NG-SE-24 TaxID=3436928 RepID=UPI003D98D8D2